MSRKQDLRVQKTLQAIKTAFFSLLEEKPFEKIQVSDITSRAMINRGTFYLHYQDKYHLVEILGSEFISDIEKQVRDLSPETMRRCQRENLPLPHISYILNEAAACPKFFQLITRGESSDILFLRLSKMISIIQEELYPDLFQSPLVKKYWSAMGISASSTVIRQWVSGGMEESPEEIARMISQFMLQILSAAADYT